MSNTPKLKLIELSNGASQALVVNTGGYSILDQMVDKTVKSRGVNTPAVSPNDGDAYIVGGSPTGLWSGKANQIAYWRNSSGVWQFIVPLEGWTVRVQDDDDTNGIPKEYGYTGSAWAIPAGAGGSFTGGTLTSALNEAPIVTLASAATVNIGAAAANTISISGTTTITAFDTIASGAKRVLAFQGALTLTHNATTLILPTGSSISTAAGDVAEFVSLGSGNWRCTGYMRANGQALAGGGGGLSYLTEALSTASPNGTINVVSLTVTGGSTNADLAWAPKGTGAVMLSVPDGTATGGSKRGTNAIDLQVNRNSAGDVASGANSFTLGSANSATQQYSGGVGRQNASTSQYSYCFGALNTASALYAVSVGVGNTASNQGALAINYQNTADGVYSLASGTQSTARGIHGADVRSSGQFSAIGDNQRGEYILRRATTDATPTVLTCDGTAPATGARVALPNNSAFALNGKVVARQNTTGDMAYWEFKGVIKRGANAAATSVVGTITGTGTTTVAADSGAAAWSIAVTADTTNGAIQIQVTGEASKSIKWTCELETMELVG